MSAFFLKKSNADAVSKKRKFPQTSNKHKIKNGKIKKPNNTESKLDKKQNNKSFKKPFVKNRRNDNEQNKNSNNKNNNNNDDDGDEEILSEDEEMESNENLVNGIADHQYSDDEIEETPQDKRLKLAKKYLQEIEREEQERADDKESSVDQQVIAKRLNDDYFSSIGKLKRQIAEQFNGYDTENIQICKHKLQKLPLTCLCLSIDNAFMFTGSKTQFIIKWDMATMKAIGKIDVAASLERIENTTPADSKNKKNRGKYCKTQTLALALSSDFKFLAVADNSFDIKIFCPVKLTHLHTFKGHRGIVTGIVFRRDAHDLYSASKDRSIKIWSLDEMAYIETLFGHQSEITGIDALTRERAISAGGIDCSIRIWKIAEESQLVYNGHKGSIEMVRLINEETFVSGGDDGALCIWSAMKKKPIAQIDLAHGVSSVNGLANWISSIATLLNSDMIASGSCDGLIKLWQLTDNYRKINFMFDIKVCGFVNALQFTQDGSKLIAIVGQEHRLGRWSKIKEAKNVIMVFPLTKK